MYFGILKCILISILTVAVVTGIPDDLFCCSPDMGIFLYRGMSNATCWQKRSNETNPVRLTCPTFYMALEKHFNITTSESGRVFSNHALLDEPKEIVAGTICFGNYTDATTGKFTKVVAFCADEDEENLIVFSIFMLVSAVFLLLTAVVYAALPEMRDLQGKSIINFCGSMGIGLAVLSIYNLIPPSNMTICAVRGFLAYYFLVASFFWSNVISVQVLLSLRRPVVNDYSWKEFSWYALYAWGCPTVLTACMAIVNYYPGNHKKPGIGLNTCWFYNKTQQWYYMYSVITTLIIANICIFTYTSVCLWRRSYSSSYTKALKYKFFMTLRMFIVMGVTWIFESISSLTKNNIIWFIIDTFNTLQGPLIFLLLVVFRKRVIKALLKRGCLACLAGPVERYLADKEDDEEEVIHDTADVTMDDRNGTDN